MKFPIPNAVTLKMARQAFMVKQNSPSLLFGAGIVGMTTSTVLACRSTLKLETVMTKAKLDLDLAKTLEPEDPSDYTDEDRKKDIAIIYIRGAGSMVKLYAPAVLLGAASIAVLTKSHHILQERNLALTAAYATVAEAFDRYRSKVVDKYGENADRDLFYETEKVIVIDEKTGKKVTRTRINPDIEPSMYARFFDETSSSWSKESEYNYTFLRCKQNWFNDLLVMRGYVMLNQVYEELGLLPTSAGAVVGWTLDGEGDSFIDFGIFRDDDKARDFVNGREKSILLDFNVDGVVYTKLDDLKEGFKPWQS